MTRKRYIKLLYALMQEMNKEYVKMFGTTAPKCGRVLKGVQKANPIIPYADAWECLKDIRKTYGM